MRTRALLVIFLFVLAGCSSPGSKPAANVSPVAVFTASTDGLSVTVDAAASLDPDGTIVAYTWAFGDGSTASGVAAAHAYAAGGTYAVTLNVTDDRGVSASSQQTVTVVAPAAPARATVSGSLTYGSVFPEEFRSGEILVRFADAGLRVMSAGLYEAGLSVQLQRPTALPDTGFYVNRALSPEQTLELARRLEARPDVLYAVPNGIVRPLRVPDDELYGLQWHYPAMNLPAAWDITTGSPQGVVAVVDSGILWSDREDEFSHPDFTGKILPGYDFISGLTSANDGDGRDPNPYDAGDNPDPYRNSYHGSHVAGTIAAATDNGTGVAGVDWQARVVPVRALGVEGGTFLDILEGMLWASGIDVSGVPSNQNPARVINMSLGAAGTACAGPVADAINLALGNGAILVVAAGNDGVNMADTFPANCPGVITVGALDNSGSRATYSNFGSGVEVMAPGGLMSQIGVDPGGVLSTAVFWETPQGGYLYSYQQGTSMASPHVAGLASLMLSLDPDLTAGQVSSILQASAVPMSVSQCNTGGPVTDCGSGAVDALAALQLVQAGGTPDPGPEPEPGPDPAPSGPQNVRAVRQNTDGSFTLLGEVNLTGPAAAYSFEAEAGDAYVLAWTDEDGSNSLTPGDWYGEYPERVNITAGSSVADINITLQPLTEADLQRMDPQRTP